MMSETRVDALLSKVPLMPELLAARAFTRNPAWLVGGCVRDLLLERDPCDVDIATQHPEPLARRFAELTGNSLVPMDPERGIWRVAARGRMQYDFCRFRDHDILGDLRGRDFTFNAIALRLPEHERPGGLFDPFHGLDDLHHGRLRMVYAEAFADDPCRVLRAFRFLADLRLAVQEDTMAAMRAEVYRLAEVAPERLLTEWWKLCDGPFAADAVRRMDEIGALDVLLPEMTATKGVTQNAYHHLDVFEHSLLVMTYVARNLRHPDEVLHDLLPEFSPLLEDPHRRARLVFLGLIHDVGKPVTRSVRDDKVHFYNHDAAGAELAEVIARRLRMSRADLLALGTVIRRHLRPLFLSHDAARGGPSNRAMGHFFDDVGDLALEVLFLALADKAASQGAATTPEIVEQLRALYRTLFAFYHQRYLPAHRQPLLTGIDLIRELSVAPGPRIGQLLQRARRLQYQGSLTTRDAALKWAAGEIKGGK